MQNSFCSIASHLPELHSEPVDWLGESPSKANTFNFVTGQTAAGADGNNNDGGGERLSEYNKIMPLMHVASIQPP